jgi:L-2-amino-thiazoline-4-carboxylic acid hydrolase
MEAAMADNAYPHKILSSFQKMAQAVRIRLLMHYPAKLIWSVFADTRRELENLIPNIPPIGEKNIWQFNLDASAMSLALYRSLKKQGFSIPETALMFHRIYDAYLLSFPKPLRLAYSWYYFSPWSQARLRQSAAYSQLKKHSQDWVFTYVKGDGLAFDVGVDISECAILKFYRAQGAEELVPHLCKLDNAMGKYLGLGFTRQGTLAEGGPVCDCRWKRGAETLNWTPAINPVYKEEKWKPSLNNM